MKDDRLPPAAVDAERHIIGVIAQFQNDAAEVFKRLKPADFIDERHKLIFAKAAKQFAAGEIDPVLLGRECKAASYLAELGSEAVTVAHVPTEAAKIIEARDKRRLFLLGRDLQEDACNGRLSDDIKRTLLADLDEWQRETVATKPQFPLFSAADLAATAFTLNYIAERLLVERQSCVLGGPKKSLKTTLAVLLAIYLAIGRDVFDKFRVQRSYRVLIASAESGMATIKETALRICSALGVELADIEGLMFTSNVPKPNDQRSMARFRAAVVESECEVLILDPFYRMHDGDGQESLFKMGAVFGKVADFCDELGLTHIICHHLKTSRANPHEPAELDDLAYAGFAEHARQWLLIARREAYQPGSGYHALWLTIGGSAGHNSLWALDIHEGSTEAPGGRTWWHELRRADDVRQEVHARQERAKADKEQQQLNEDRQAVFKLLRMHTNGLSKSAIGREAGIPNRRWPKSFNAMLEAGELVETEIYTGNHKKPSEGYKLRGNSDA